MIELSAPPSQPHITKADLDAWRRDLWKRFGGFPERCDLNVEKLEEVEVGEFIREKLRYQLEKGEWVESYLARPKNITHPLPAILALHSHGVNYPIGKAEIFATCDPDPGRKFYGWGYELVKRGYVVIAQDQLAFESRSWIQELGLKAAGLDERFEGFRRLAEGRTLMGKLGYDTSRAVDVLAQRDDVDPDKIGAIGHSGGGSQSYTAMLYDPRIIAGVFNCGIASGAASIRDFKSGSLTSLLPGLAYIGDKALAVATMVPRAVMIVNGSEDRLFSLDGVMNTYYRAKKAYLSLGVKDRIELTMPEGPHVFHEEIREHGYRWLDRWLKETPIQSDEIWYREERPDPAEVKAVKITVDGFRDLCGRYSDNLPEPEPEQRKKIITEEQKKIKLEEIRIIVEEPTFIHNKRLGLEPPNEPSEYLSNIRCRIEKDHSLDIWVAEPTNAPSSRLPAVILLHHSEHPYDTGRDEVMGLAGNQWYAMGPELAGDGRLVAAMDLYGHATRKNPLHQTQKKPSPERSQIFPANQYIDAGTSLLERSVHEIRCLIAYLKTRDDVDPGRIDIVGFGTGAFVGLTTAVLEPTVRSVVAVSGVTTVDAAIKNKLYHHPFLYQPNIVPSGDLDNAFRYMAPRRCRLICFEGDDHWPAEGARRVIDTMRAAYGEKGNSDALDVQWLKGKPGSGDTVYSQIVSFLDH